MGLGDDPYETWSQAYGYDGHCNKSIFDRLMSVGYLKANLTYGERTNGCEWTCDDVVYYNERERWYDWVITVGSKTTHFLPWKLFHVGVVCNFVLLLILLSPTLSGTVTFMFLRTITLVHLGLGLLYYTLPGPSPDLANDWYFNQIWLANAHVLISAGKFFTIVITVFLTLDRFLAVCFLEIYSKINSRIYFGVSLFVSFLISSLEMVYIATYSQTVVYVDYSKIPDQINKTNRFAVRNGGMIPRDESGTFWNNIYVGYIVYAIIAVKIFILVVMGLCGFCIVIKLFQRGRQIHGLMSSDAAVKEFREMMLLCRFQMVDTIFMVVDVVVTVLMNLQRVVEDPGNYRGYYCSMSQNLYCLNMYLGGWLLDVTIDQFKALEHGELLFVYLIFFKKFRSAFLNVLKIGFEKVKLLSDRLTGRSQKALVINVSPTSRGGASVRQI